MMTAVRWRAVAVQCIGFGLVFLLTVGSLNLLRTSDIFWSLLSSRFGKDPAYQLQNVFLPDREREVAVLVLGDSLFQNSIPDSVADGVIERVVLQSVDSTDVVTLFKGIAAGERATHTRICTVIMQASPNFMARAKPLGDPLVTANLTLARKGSLESVRRAGYVFRILKSWVEATPAAGDVRDLPPLRLGRHVALARFADPQLENWTDAVAVLRDHKSPILLATDPRGTDWGAGSDLVAALPAALTATEGELPQVAWIPVDRVAGLPKAGCADGSAEMLRAAARRLRGS